MNACHSGHVEVRGQPWMQVFALHLAALPAPVDAKLIAL